jgi:hypothetical protein
MAIDILKGASTTPLVFLMIDSSDHITGKTGLSPTVTLSKNGGSFGSPSGSVTEIANGWYKVAGNATDSNTAGPLVLHATGSGADPTDIMAANVIDPTVAVYGVNAVQLNAQTITAAAGVTFPSSVASPTNITAGTITTVTNLTNAPTAGDFTSTMKTSLNAATPVATLSSAYDFAKGTVAMTESYAAVSSTMTPAQALYMIWALLENRSIASTTLTAKKVDGSTAAMTFTLDSATTPTSQVRAT